MEKKELYLQLLNERLQAIDDRSFDFNSWKKATLLVAENCFGSNSPHLKALQNINYEYNSWALRDESGVSDPVKTNCKSILQQFIRELELSEAIQTESKESKDLNFMWLPFEDELTGSASKQLKALLAESTVSQDDIEKFLKNLPAQTPIEILKRILSADEFRLWLKQ